MLQATANSNRLLIEAEKIARDFELDALNIARTTQSLHEWLQTELRHNGSAQIPTFVSKVPDGTEKGIYLAVDLGGTNCRVSLIHLHGDATYTITQAKDTIPKELMVNSSHEPLFDFIAGNIARFMEDHAEEMTHVEINSNPQPTQGHYFKLGFTFSFTFTNTCLERGTLLQWDKGWDIPDALGKDPSQMLQSAIDRLSLPVRVAAITSDSVGTLLARSYSSLWRSSTLLGAIFGTGTNAAYVERRENVLKLAGSSTGARADTAPGQELMVINTEWGGWCDDEPAALGTVVQFDTLLDQSSSNPTKQLLEKRVSGLYLGEIVRLVILHLLDQGLFDMKPNEPSSPVFIPYGIDTSFLARLADDPDEVYEAAKQTIARYAGVTQVSINDARAVRLIAKAVVQRSGRLAGAAMAAIILQSGRLSSSCNRCTTKVKGSSDVVSQDEDIERSTRTRMHNKPRNLCALVTALFNGIAHRIRSLYTKPLDYSSQATESIFSPSSDTADTPQVVDIGVEGSLFESYPNFEHYIRGALRDIPGIGVEGEKLISIGVADHGSSLGAALAAQSAG
ncbi:glucokinase [Penicillium canariense]|uniref:Phosphotransferase n=1 Tax=Penicillium canariense TaxID=189055 RepID=A0A9W9LE76_9EURO|nr:glucokinase [Penicillium canariense]KAJ5151058.1 glucokinase [Penicillium canariense]